MVAGLLGIEKMSESDRAPGSEFPALHRLTSTYADVLRQSDLGSQIRKRLLVDKRMITLTEHLVRSGRGYSEFNVDRLAMWWLWRLNEENSATADRDLETYLDSDTTEVIITMWVYGIEVDGPLALTDNISIVPPLVLPPSFDRKEIVDHFNHQFIGLGRSHMPGAAMITRQTVRKLGPRLSSIKDDERPRPSEENETNRLIRDIQEMALLLNCLPDITCCSGYKTIYLPPEVPFGPFGESGGSTSIPDVIPLTRRSISNADLGILPSLLEGFQRLPDLTKNRVTLAIRRLAQAKWRGGLWEKALDLGIALEMLLLNQEHAGNEAPDQLGLHFRLRGASILGKTQQEKRQYVAAFNKIYSHRSQVAHNGMIKDNPSLSHLLSEHTTLAEQVFQKFIVDGQPKDWLNLTFGCSEE